ncbi:MAG TPA: hypothetical protein VMK12_17535 [Anaeromyxobacteraceae bacterium]|nr:hypothetical protein [Anaeromyxobacteraceae bacterium]
MLRLQHRLDDAARVRSRRRCPQECGLKRLTHEHFESEAALPPGADRSLRRSDPDGLVRIDQFAVVACAFYSLPLAYRVPDQRAACHTFPGKA